MDNTFAPPLKKSRAKPAPARVTIRTVAEDAGVSVSAVSKVLRNAYGVSDGLRARVMASIEKLDYRPSASARGMRGQSYTLGVLLTDIRNVFFAEIMEGINDTLAPTPYQPLLGVSQLRRRVERSLVDAIIDRQMDGLILVAPRMPLPEIEDVAKRLPTVVIGSHPAGTSRFDTVNNDDILGGEAVVDYLNGLGLRRITFFTLTEPDDDDDENTVMMHRERGYVSAMTRLGLDVNIERAAHDTVAEAARRLVASKDRPEAIFCWGDAWALRVISAATDLGVRIPQDIRVVGYDNNQYCELAQNSLTSVDQSGRELGKQAARLLIERIEGRREPYHFTVTPSLIVRNSTGG
ncbi:LacI family transcriptional regulator [Devosia pacifica]|uniref:LacI family transcriptional regulator n=1 Tax=Devosia pacifica TaxID=1335967 RepID=A0A918S336_9HYPH|nr:LacI family DNA-binding transcriptional regulator [Devosia pacifica]GHA22038.1 LacI family transcriptional regulator [Devosia pacifica]